MPRTRQNTGQNSDSETFDPNNPSTWLTTSLSQLRSLTVAMLQQELKNRNLRNKAVLSQRLHDTLCLQSDAIPSNSDATQSITSLASQHSDATAGHDNALTNEMLSLLSVQLQQLPQQQLMNLLIQAISSGNQISQSQITASNPHPPVSQPPLVIPTPGATVTPTPPTQSSTVDHQWQITNLLIQAISQATQPQVTNPTSGLPTTQLQTISNGTTRTQATISTSDLLLFQYKPQFLLNCQPVNKKIVFWMLLVISH